MKKGLIYCRPINQGETDQSPRHMASGMICIFDGDTCLFIVSFKSHEHILYKFSVYHFSSLFPLTY